MSRLVSEKGVRRMIHTRKARTLSRFLVLSLFVLSSGVAFAAGGEQKSDDEVMKETIFQGVNLLILLGVLIGLSQPR